MHRRGVLAAAGALLLLLAGWFVAGGWYGSGPLDEETAFVVPDGSSLAAVAEKLEREGAIGSARGFRWRARLFGG